MTVVELIAKLQEMPQAAEVVIMRASDYGDAWLEVANEAKIVWVNSQTTIWSAGKNKGDKQAVEIG